MFQRISSGVQVIKGLRFFINYYEDRGKPGMPLKALAVVSGVFGGPAVGEYRDLIATELCRKHALAPQGFAYVEHEDATDERDERYYLVTFKWIYASKTARRGVIWPVPASFLDLLTRP